MSAISTATAGIISATQRFEKAAANTARNASNGQDILSDLVEQINSRNAGKAMFFFSNTADERLGSLLDIKT